MTRHHVNRTLRVVFWSLGLVLAVAFVAKLGPYLIDISGTRFEPMAKDLYLYLKEMAPVFITVVAVYLASIFRKRSNFTESLEEEWRNIVRTKAALYAYFEKPYPTSDDYVAVNARLSETIDTMRIVYRNVGETKDLIGFYPYEALHDMRRVLKDMDPRTKSGFTALERKRAQDCVEQLFSALRENFLDELDLQEPGHPLLAVGARRMKQRGGTKSAKKKAEKQKARQNSQPSAKPELDAYLGGLHAAEQAASEKVASNVTDKSMTAAATKPV
jgi:hypothetical protein